MNKTIAALYGIFFGLLTAAAFGLLDYGTSLLYPSATKAVVFDQQDKIAYMFGAVLFAPLFETLIFQMGIIELANHWFKERRRLSLVLSTLLFSALHLFNSATQARNMIFFGAVMAMIYGAFRKHSVAHAFVATFATHTTHNLLLVLAAILFPQLA